MRRVTVTFSDYQVRKTLCASVHDQVSYRCSANLPGRYNVVVLVVLVGVEPFCSCGMAILIDM